MTPAEERQAWFEYADRVTDLGERLVHQLERIADAVQQLKNVI